jgi:hypothetical protein
MMTRAEVEAMQVAAKSHKSQTQSESFQMALIQLLAELVLTVKQGDEKSANA